MDDDYLDEEGFETGALDQSSRDFLEAAIQDYNALFGTSFDTCSDKFQNYYKDLSLRLKNREIDLVIVVNMFLTGFDATTLNTLFVDKRLVNHGLIQAYSRTNRILNSVKTYGNIVTFRDLEEETNDAIALFGNKDAKGIVLLKPYAEYYDEYAEKVQELLEQFPLGQPIIGESAQKAFIALFGQILRLQNILTTFDDFAGNEILTERQSQDYRSVYLDLYAEFRKDATAEKESINDDVVFEIELIKQVEINVDYILMLVQKYREASGDGEDREIRAQYRTPSTPARACATRRTSSRTSSTRSRPLARSTRRGRPTSPSVVPRNSTRSSRTRTSSPRRPGRSSRLPSAMARSRPPAPRSPRCFRQCPASQLAVAMARRSSEC